MLAGNYYHQTTRRYVAMFGTLFNNIVITREDNSGSEEKRFKVPLNYAPMQKILARLEQNPDLQAKPAMVLPRMSFEITNIEYDPERAYQRTLTNRAIYVSDAGEFNSQFVPSPYNIQFQLNVYAKYAEDGFKIIEQIIPYFKPEWTSSVKIIDDPETIVDIPIVLDSVTMEDSYQGNFEERRAIVWTLSFTLKGSFYGPVTRKKIIKFANTTIYTSLSANTGASRVTVRPGLTANGEPTTDIANTVPLDEIEASDNWGLIVQIEEL